jgi:ribonuclease P protein component
MISIQWVSTHRMETRLGITVSRRFGAAHERNRFKRLIREIFRTTRSNFPVGLDLNIAPRNTARSIQMETLRKEFTHLASALYVF